jgi:prophage antirepressor-like protein
MNDLKVFAYGEQQVRTVLIDNEPWWVLVDVCKVLGLKESHRVAARLDEDEKMTMTRTSVTGQLWQRGGAQRLIAVNESGLYSVVLRSDKPEAKEFKRWITHEVLPSIRQTGAYTASSQPPVNTVPVAKPATPELSVDARLKRAELLIRAAEHPALPQDEQVRLLNRAAIDLTGMGIESLYLRASVPRDPQFLRPYTSTDKEEVEQ